MAEQYWVWALGRDNEPLTTEGPWGPYDAQTARTYGRISATEGTHDRAVSHGKDPQASSFEIVRIYRAGSGEHVYAGGGVVANPGGLEYYDVRLVHKISPSDKDRMGPVAIPDNAFSDRNTLAAALRDAGVLQSGGRLNSFRVEGEKVVAFPAKSIWHSIVLTPSTESGMVLADEGQRMAENVGEGRGSFGEQEGDYIIVELGPPPSLWDVLYIDRDRRSGRRGYLIKQGIGSELFQDKNAALSFIRSHAKERGAYHAVIFEQRSVGDVRQIGNFVEGRLQMMANSTESSYGSNAGVLDEHAATELKLYIDNTYELMGPGSQGDAIRKNLLLKIKSGTFDFERSVQGWMHLVETGAKSYAREFASPGEWSQMFSVPTRKAVARELAEDFQRAAQGGEYEANEARPHGELNWYKITYSAPAGGTAVTHVRAPSSAEALERAAFQIGYTPDVWTIEGLLNGDWTRL